MITKPEKPEDTESALDEANEPVEVQSKEKAEGTEQHGTVPLTEEFQLMAIDLLKNASKEECSFVSNLCFERQDAIRSESEPSMDDYNAVKSSD